MSQDMDENSMLDMSSDIDEREKEKAIESIVLEARADDDFDEPNMLVDDDNSRNVTNSLYDAQESLKMTNIENGGESTEMKDEELDPLENEHLTNIACIETPPMPTTPPPQTPPPPPPPLPPPPTTTTTAAAAPATSITTTPNQIIVTKSVVGSSTVPTSPKSNKILYVKLIQKGPSLVTKSPPKSISITTLKSKYDKPFDKTDAKKVSPIKMTIEEPTTSNICSTGPNKPVEHTVNLLNNNRILIKSVKNNHSNSAPVATIACASKSVVCEGFTTSLQTQVKSKDDTKYQVDVTNEVAAPCAVNFTQTKEIDQSGANDMKCAPIIINNGSMDKNELEIKKEQILNENSMDGDTDAKLSDTTNEDKNLLSAQKIKREFEQLQKTVNESKVLSEFVIEHNKRNRRPTKSGKSKHKHNNIIDTNSTIDDSKTVMLINRSVSPSSSSVRSASKESDRSATSSFTSSAGKRNTRSMNTDFSAKQKRFLKGIQQVTRGTDDETDNNSGADDDDDDLDYYAKQQPIIIERRKSTVAPKHAFNSDIKNAWDKYCWRCHQTDTNIFCSSCIRSYHAGCLKMKVLSISEMGKYQCPECIDIKAAEKENKKKKFDVKHFNKLLKYAMNRVLQDPNLQQFQFPVNKTQNPGYGDVIVNPINLSKIENNIDNLVYTNSESFLSDIKWILHNCSIYFSDNYKVTRAAKSLQKVSKQEVGDIETCPECYLNANTMTDNWFTETCAKPHLILWAKLKGFPYWPAKAMSINSTLVDVRFFGEHDRANIPSKDCYLYSLEDPNPPTNKYKRNTIADCVKEVDIYVENIIAKYGSFEYAAIKTPFNPQTAEQHLFAMIPGLRTARGRRRSSTARPDLTLKIVKTADNNLSVVKKDQTPKEVPQIKRTVDITGDETVSRTPTPPSAVLARRKTSDTRIKRTKSTNRHSEGKLVTLDSKSYQAMRRKSMAVEKLDQKRVSAIHSKVELNTSNESSDVSFVQYNPKSTIEINETDLVANIILKKPIKTITKKRKLSVDQAKPSDPLAPPEKSMKLDDSKSATTSKDDRSDDDFGANILRSVGLVKKMPAPSQPEQQPSIGKCGNSNPKVVLSKNLTCDKNETNGGGAARTRKDIGHRTGSKEDSSPLVLVPFVEVKKEADSESNTPNITPGPPQTPSSSQPILISSNESTPAKNGTNADDNLSNIKTETSSDDDSLMIIEDDATNELLDSIRRGCISVKDINKMTSTSKALPHQQARKSFPKGPSSASILKPRNNTANIHKLPPMNNMVSIPRDGLQRLDISYNSTQPPPLSVVGSGNSVSLLAQNQPFQSVPPLVTSTTSVSNLSNGPPPLSITSMATVVSVAQPSLLNPTSITSISNGMITEQLASAVTDQIIRRNPPQLVARPVAPLRSDGDSIFPSEAGSVCKTLMENAHKMTDFFRSVIEDTLGDLSTMSNPEAKIRLLEIEMEKLKSSHAKEITEVKANTDRILLEMKKNLEKDKARLMNEVRKQCEMERIRSIEDAKRKQWCANCLKEAQFYCCWNTSYCNHNCQRKHWEQHMTTCAQLETTPPNVQNSRKSSTKTQPKPEVRVQAQSSMHPKPQVLQKDNIVALSGRNSGVKIGNNPMVPALRTILPKNISVNSATPPTRHPNPVIQPQIKQTANSQCIILGRSIPNWAGSTSKSASLLHSNTIFLPSSQPYATLTNVAPSSTGGVSLLNSSHAQSQKSIANETIIIP